MSDRAPTGRPEPDGRDDLDLSGTGRRIHLVGAGGSGMSAIATVLAGMGHRVTGSDLKESSSLGPLRALGIEVFIGHDPGHVGDADLVAISSAVPPTNVEVAAAVARGIRVASRADALRAITSLRPTIAVGGTHGKTTTASMLALVLVDAGRRPSFVIGGEVNEIGSGAAWDDGDWFVVEADESDGTHLRLHRQAAIVTSVEPDHLAHHGSVDALVDAFRRFAAETAGPVVVCADDPRAAALAGTGEVVSYGTSDAADFQLVDVELARSTCSFGVAGPPGSSGREHLGTVDIAVPGLHNARNAAAALVMGLQLGLSFDEARHGLARFAGVARRFEFRGQSGGVTFVDDYAHLPTEVGAALAAARAGEWARIVCVFQPHRYSRTADLWRSFADCFEDADHLVITDIYSAGEQARPGVTGKLIVDAVLDAHPWRRVAYLPRHEELVSYLVSELRPGDLCLTLGAGDLTTVPDEVMADLARRTA